ncbi:MAG: MaoC family dehydratase [Dehalococcoidia bacterium]|nr:MaoC family dehydratase [Dehalococcoidia bacterium]
MSEEIYQGKILSPVVRNITQDKINLYAGASGDFNPIHIDESFAARTPLGGTIAHGMLVLSYVSEIMSQSFGRGWSSGGKLSMRFKAPARPGDTITVTGKVNSLEEREGVPHATCSLDCRNQKGELIVTGEAVVGIARKENTHGSK